MYLLAPSSALAAFSFSIASVEPQSSANPDTEFTVNLSLVDLPSPSYFRAAFQQAEGKPYFGYIKNHLDQWVKVENLSSETCNQYFRIENTATTSAALKLKIGPDTIPPVDTYQIRAHRFTEACSYKSADNSLPVTIDFPQPTPTPTPSPLPVPTPTDTPLPTSTKAPTPSHTPPPTKTPVPTLVPTPVSTPTLRPSSTQPPSPAPTLSPTMSPVPEVLSATTPSGTFPALPILIIAAGCAGLLASAKLIR
jgi:hypothetical protein